MGWTSFYSEDSLELVVLKEVGAWGYDVMGHNMVRETHNGTDPKDIENAVAYLAVKHPKGYVFGLVVLLNKRREFPGGRDEVYYKEMDESQGPNYYNMSEEVFSLLTPIPDQGEYSKEWREKVKSNINK